MAENAQEAGQPCAKLDRLKLVLFAASFLLALSLAAQKWFLAPRVAEVVKDFGVDPSAITRLIVFSPRTLAIRFASWSLTLAGLCLVSRRVAFVVTAGLLLANLVSLGVIGAVYLDLLHDLS